MVKKDWFVYIVETQNGNLYTGCTTDPIRRFQEHSSKKIGAKYFRVEKPRRFLYVVKVENRSVAQIEEAKIKKLSKAKKLLLIKKGPENLALSYSIK